MAVTISTDLITLYDANSSFAGSNTFSGFQRFGTACNGVQVSNSTEHFYDTVPTFDLTGKAIYSWLAGPGSIAPIAQGGYRIVIGDGTNVRGYFVGGSDVSTFRVAGWDCLVLHGDSLPTNFTQIEGANEPNLANLTQVGIGFTTLAKATGNSPNCFYDVTRVGTGLTISGDEASPGTFLNIANADALTSNAWGVVRVIDEGIYGSQGRLTFGDTSSNSTFEERDTYLIFESRLVPTDFYKITTIGGSTTTNSLTFGTKIGTGESATGGEGVTIISNRGLALDFLSDNSTTNLYGSTIVGSTQNISFSSNNSNNEIISTIIRNSGNIDFGDAFTNDNTITNSTLLLDDITDFRNTDFDGSSGGHGIVIETVTEYNFNNITFSNYGADETLDAAVYNNSGGEVIINVLGGGTSPTVRNGTGATTTINNPITFTITNLIEDSEVRIFRQDDLSELGGVESVSNTPIGVNGVTVSEDPNAAGRFRVSYNYNHSVDIDVFVVIFKETRIGIYQSLTLGGTDSSFFATQQFDRQYQV